MLEIENLTKTFGTQTVISDISMTLVSGKIYGLVGRNGSGKTMLMKMILGFVSPSSGSIKIEGKVLGKDISMPDRINCNLFVVVDDVAKYIFRHIKRDFFIRKTFKSGNSIERTFKLTNICIDIFSNIVDNIVRDLCVLCFFLFMKDCHTSLIIRSRDIDWKTNRKARAKTFLKVCEILWRFIRSNDNLLARFI